MIDIIQLVHQQPQYNKQQQNINQRLPLMHTLNPEQQSKVTKSVKQNKQKEYRCTKIKINTRQREQLQSHQAQEQQIQGQQQQRHINRFKEICRLKEQQSYPNSNLLYRLNHDTISDELPSQNQLQQQMQVANKEEDHKLIYPKHRCNNCHNEQIVNNITDVEKSDPGDRSMEINVKLYISLPKTPTKQRCINPNSILHTIPIKNPEPPPLTHNPCPTPTHLTLPPPFSPPPTHSLLHTPQIPKSNKIKILQQYIRKLKKQTKNFQYQSKKMLAISRINKGANKYRINLSKFNRDPECGYHLNTIQKSPAGIESYHNKSNQKTNKTPVSKKSQQKTPFINNNHGNNEFLDKIQSIVYNEKYKKNTKKVKMILRKRCNEQQIMAQLSSRSIKSIKSDRDNKIKKVESQLVQSNRNQKSHGRVLRNLATQPLSPSSKINTPISISIPLGNQYILPSVNAARFKTLSNEHSTHSIEYSQLYAPHLCKHQFQNVVRNESGVLHNYSVELPNNYSSPGTIYNSRSSKRNNHSPINNKYLIYQSKMAKNSRSKNKLFSQQIQMKSGSKSQNNNHNINFMDGQQTKGRLLESILFKQDKRTKRKNEEKRRLERNNLSSKRQLVIYQ